MSQPVYRQTDSEAFNSFQQSSGRAIAQLESSPLSGAVLIEDIATTAATEQSVETGLAQVRGFVLAKSDAAMTVYSSGSVGGTLKITPSATGKISLLVF